MSIDDVKQKAQKQNNSKQDLTTKRSKTIQIQCSPLLAEGPIYYVEQDGSNFKASG